MRMLVFETRLPAVISARETRPSIGERTSVARTFRFQPVDFAVDDLGAALEAGGHDRDVPTTWLWEGVVPYLTRHDVIATLRVLGDRSVRGSTLIVNYQTPSPRARAGRLLAGVLARLGRTPTITANEPWRTLLTPEFVPRATHGPCNEAGLAAALAELAIEA